MAVKFIRRKPNSKTIQKEVNALFVKIVKELYDDILDEACKICYEQYRIYPNVYTIKIMREMLDTTIVDVSINKEDYYNYIQKV